MNFSEENDEENNKSQSVVDFIPYRLLGEITKISEGVFGSVYECIYTPTNEKRTLKLLSYKPERCFTTELASAFRLKHENIIRFYGRTCIGSFNGILTELLEGTSLKEVIHDESISYSLTDVLLWNIQSFRALEYVIQSFPGRENKHFRRYFNRNVCPENMILNPTRDVLKICSLGLFIDIPNPKNSIKTNYSYYWAPEVCKEEYRYEESDVYSFGVVLWECITRAKPENHLSRREKKLNPIWETDCSVETSFKFQQFMDRCTDLKFSKNRFLVSEILAILENMILAEPEQDLDVFRWTIISFWNDEEFYYCKKLIFFENIPDENSDDNFSFEEEKGEKWFNYHLLKKNLKELASGKFGKVCSTEYEGMKVAVKFQIAMEMKPFLHELRITSELDHENIVKIIGQTQGDGVYGVVMEYIHGTSLHNIIYETTKNYTLGDMLTWNYQAVSALEYMHSFRCLHRDIKPDNMLIENSDKRTLKLVDLGGAKMITNSLSSTVMGTEFYIAPEIDNGDHYDEKCDVYSWTITFWECLTAERPQIPANYRSKIDKICSAKFVEIIELCSSSNPAERKFMFVMKKWLEDMLNNRKTYTDTDSNFRENRICIWNEETNELYYFAKTETNERSQNALTEAECLFVNVPLAKLKIIKDLAFYGINGKRVEIDISLLKPRGDSLCSCGRAISLENLQSVTHGADKKTETFRSKCSWCIEAKTKVFKCLINASKICLENEFLVLSKLKHENIIKLIAYTHDNELDYFGFITNYFLEDGRTLEQVMANLIYFTETMLHWSLQSARALEYMHSQNILHCDIKPANFIVSPAENRLEICGFDLSRDLRYSHPKEAVGTGIYMAPEVRRDGLLTTKSDVYSWTVTFWELCKRQFQQILENDNTYKSIMEGMTQMESIDLLEEKSRTWIENGSNKFNDFIYTCSNSDPDKRWSMTEIVKLFENMIENNSNSNYLPDFDNIQADMIVKDNICLWSDLRTEYRTKKDFFYASSKFSFETESIKHFKLIRSSCYEASTSLAGPSRINFQSVMTDREADRQADAWQKEIQRNATELATRASICTGSCPENCIGCSNENSFWLPYDISDDEDMLMNDETEA